MYLCAIMIVGTFNFVKSLCYFVLLLVNIYIYIYIGKSEDIYLILRWFILVSISQEGISSKKKLEFFKREIIQTYGIEYIYK